MMAIQAYHEWMPIQAYHEWMPIRVPDAARPDRIYRSFDFGNLLSLHMLDTRVIGRDKQLAYASYAGADGSFNSAGFTAEVSNPTRQLMGTEQTTWLQNQMTKSTATWQILGQQVLMARMLLPAPMVLTASGYASYLAIAAKVQAGVALSDAETASRGFVVLTVTPSETRAEYRYVDTIQSKTYTASVGKTLRMLPGASNRKIVAG